MMYSSGMNKLVKRVPGFIMAIGTIKLRNQLKRENKSDGLHYGYLMTQIMNHYFYLEEKKYRQTLYLDQYHLSYDEMILEVIDETIRYCYQKNETQK